MNCDEYLSRLATLPVEELAESQASEHATTCRECNRVTRMVVERERTMLAVYGNLHASVPSARTAETALRASRRRKVSLYYRIGLGLSAVATLLYAVYTVREPVAPVVGEARETIRLQCLSPEQAAEVLRPYLGQSGSISIRPPLGLGLIHLQTTAKKMATAHKVLDRLDNPAASQCAVQVRVPQSP